MLETRMVILGRFGQPALTDLSVLFDVIGADIIPFDADHCDVAFREFQQFGKGMGTAAKLNMGDCASYALATTLRSAAALQGPRLPRYRRDPAVSPVVDFHDGRREPAPAALFQV
jgi:ribonuclease VapC